MAETQDKSQATFRIPLVSAYNTREFDPAASAEDSTVSGYVGLGIVGLMIVGYPLTSGKDVRYVNMMPVKLTNPLTGKEYFYAQKRPGWAADQTLDAAENATAMTIWRGYDDGTHRIYGIGTDIYRNSSANNLGTITGAAEFISETTLGGDPTLTIISDDSTGWFFPSAGAMTNITDTDFPPEATPAKTLTGPMVHMNGYAFVLTTDGYIHNSDQNTLADWTATNFFITNSFPDKGIGLARYKHHLVAFGTNTMEFLNDVGTPNESPLQRLDSLTIRLGCINQHSYKNVEDSIVWVSSAATGGSSVYVLDGYTPKKISTPIIDTQISLSTTDDISIQTAKIFGRTLIFLNLETKTYVFSLEDNIWHEWSSGFRYWDRMEGLSSGGGTIYGISLSTDSGIRGKSWKIDVETPVYTDNSSIYSAVITTPKLDFDNNNRKRMHKLTVVGDRYSASNTINVSWSDDDYITFSTGRDVDMMERPILHNCGQFRRRAFKLISNESNALRLEALEVLVSQGTS